MLPVWRLKVVLQQQPMHLTTQLQSLQLQRVWLVLAWLWLQAQQQQLCANSRHTPLRCGAQHGPLGPLQMQLVLLALLPLIP